MIPDAARNATATTSNVWLPLATQALHTHQTVAPETFGSVKPQEFQKPVGLRRVA
jgi:hypothetical protein